MLHYVFVPCMNMSHFGIAEGLTLFIYQPYLFSKSTSTFFLNSPIPPNPALKWPPMRCIGASIIQGNFCILKTMHTSTLVFCLILMSGKFNVFYIPLLHSLLSHSIIICSFHYVTLKDSSVCHDAGMLHC